jgi:hypothetical protein
MAFVYGRSLHKGKIHLGHTCHSSVCSSSVPACVAYMNPPQASRYKVLYVLELVFMTQTAKFAMAAVALDQCSLISRLMALLALSS